MKVMRKKTQRKIKARVWRTKIKMRNIVKEIELMDIMIKVAMKRKIILRKKEERG